MVVEAPPPTHSTKSFSDLPPGVFCCSRMWLPYTHVPEPMAVAATTHLPPSERFIVASLSMLVSPAS